MIRGVSLVFWWFILSLAAFSQQPWTLNQCIDYAVNHNLKLKQSRLNAQSSEYQLQQSKANLLPTLNGFGTHNYSFGRTIDPLTNLFATNRVQSNSVGLSSSLVVFNGFQNFNTIKQQQYGKQAREFDLLKSENDLKIEIINAFLQVLYAKELLLVSKSQLSISSQQVSRLKVLFDAGSTSKGSILELEAQFALEELQVVNAQNQLDMAYLNLIQSMNLDNALGFEIEQPEVFVKEEKNMLEEISVIYEFALKNQPAIKSAEMSVLNQERTLFIARGGLSPRLVLNASYGTGYSQLRKQPFGSPGFVGYDTVGITTGNEAVLVPRYQSDFRVTPFSSQFKDNVNKTIGLSLNIPLFNGFTVKNRINQARISFEMAKINLEQNKQLIRNEIQKAHADAAAAFKKYKATQLSLKALQEAFTYNQKKFEVGMMNTVSYNDSKNKIIKAESDLLQSKFDYLFKLKLLDYYLGKPLSL